MQKQILLSILLALSAGFFTPTLIIADEIRVAVASNFSSTLQALAHKFEAATTHKIRLISGSTGKHYAQIKHGAPFDVFFAADRKRPQRLEREGIGLAGSRFTYALGNLVLWSPKSNFIDAKANVLRQGKFQHLAIANPKLAPYGRAAKEVLKNLGLWKTLSLKLVRGENIGQAFQFVSSHNAELGFLAFSQVKKLQSRIEGSIWKIPPRLYNPIQQQAILLKDSPATQAFLRFLKTKEALGIIKAHGYNGF
jgi:molybdate transport system substrate-binding protein